LTVNYYYQSATNDTTITVAQASCTVSGSPITKPTTNGSTYTHATVSHTYTTTAYTVTIAKVASYDYYMSTGSAPTTGSSVNSVTYSFTPTANASINVYVYQRYTITYSAGTGNTGTAPATQYKIHGTALTLQSNSGSLAKTGYTYYGWSTGSETTDGSRDYAAAASYTGNANLSLYPAWTINTYTLTVNYYYQSASNDTTITVAQASCTVSGSPITKPTTNGTTYTHATVSHTYTTSSFTVTIAKVASYDYYINIGSAPTTGSSVNSKTYSYVPDSNDSINVYVYQRYTITYSAGSANSGTAPATQYKIYGTNLTLQSNSGTLAKTGYTYYGWSTGAETTNGTRSYAAAASYTGNANLSL